MLAIRAPLGVGLQCEARQSLRSNCISVRKEVRSLRGQYPVPPMKRVRGDEEE